MRHGFGLDISINRHSLKVQRLNDLSAQCRCHSRFQQLLDGLRTYPLAPAIAEMGVMEEGAIGSSWLKYSKPRKYCP